MSWPIESILVIRISSLGDVLLTTPLVRQLRRAFSEARIDMVVDTAFAEVYAHNPHISTLWRYDRQLSLKQRWRWRQRLPAYDCIIDLQRNFHAAVLRWRKGKRVRKVHKDRLRKLIAVYTPWNPYTHIVPIPQRYRQALGTCLPPDDGEGLELWLPEERNHQYYPPAVHRQVPEPLVAVAPGAKHFTKRWSPTAFATLVQQMYEVMGMRTVLIGGEEDRRRCEAIALQVPDAALAGIECHRSLYATARIVDHVRMVISNDSAAVHIAAARRKPVVVLYGSTIPAFGFLPYRVPFRVCEVKGLSCRPCTHYGRPACPKKHFACMRQLSVTDVLTAVQQLLELSDNPFSVVNEQE